MNNLTVSVCVCARFEPTPLEEVILLLAESNRWQVARWAVRNPAHTDTHKYQESHSPGFMSHPSLSPQTLPVYPTCLLGHTNSSLPLSFHFLVLLFAPITIFNCIYSTVLTHTHPYSDIYSTHVFISSIQKLNSVFLHEAEVLHLSYRSPLYQRTRCLTYNKGSR